MAKEGDEINLRRLINIGKEKGYITYRELNEDLSDDIISSEEIDDLLQMFEDLNIKVVSEPAGEQIEKVKKPEKAEEEKKERKGSLNEIEDDFAKKIYDPVKIYLREMGLVSLLSREGEVEIAKRIETGENQMLDALIRCRTGVEYIAELGNDLEAGLLKVREIVNDIEDEYNFHQIGQRRDFLLNLIGKITDLDEKVLTFCGNLKNRCNAAQRKKLRASIDKTQKKIFDMMRSFKMEKVHIQKMVDRFKETLDRLKASERELADCLVKAGAKPVSYLEECLEELSTTKEGGEKVKALNLSKEELSFQIAKIRESKDRIEEMEYRTTMSSKTLRRLDKEIDDGLRMSKAAKNALIKANL
ncbi:MAG: RNA polymerase sigma factor region1.1 domain-containing protein, partial [Desulfatiglandales bacterium]